MRGKRNEAQQAATLAWLIPAHAGKTVARLSMFRVLGAHPRACGENTPAWALSRERAGSSPRMRGKQGLVACWRPRRGLIPAHAGKTFLLFVFVDCIPAHPRACGENDNEIESAIREMGSSPRMRGKLLAIELPTDRTGLIPAHAGKTLIRGEYLPNGGAHPRACGENVSMVCVFGFVVGSSPRMRGKPELSAQVMHLCRLIPAHAGKTLRRAGWGILRGAHPRACGENPQLDQLPEGFEGSSPRMRGKPHSRSGLSRPSRLIPAHAGKTTRLDLEPTTARAHPRACGENMEALRPLAEGAGSSPRMRGKP